LTALLYSRITICCPKFGQEDARRYKTGHISLQWVFQILLFSDVSAQYSVFCSLADFGRNLN